MALKKQSIRSTQKIYLNGNPLPSEKIEIISLSESWTEKEETIFRKILQQGGNLRIQGNHFKVVKEEKMIGLRDM
tara:strand:- start:272 stop:496 length:225 start_codon:yes stop_codon:yes gene_type:complete